MWRISSLIMLFGMTDYCRPERIDNICSSGHEKRVFSGLGESGFVAAYNVIRSNASRFGFLESCQAEIISCPSCIISLTFSYMNLSCHCGAGFDTFLCSPGRSDYVWITEPSYENASGVPYCGVHPGSGPRPKLLEYKSKTRAVRVSFFYTRSHAHAFTLDYKSEPNRELFVGTFPHQMGDDLSEGFFTSPFFPATYPRDLVTEYILLCKSQSASSLLDGDSNCRIRLMFTDFQLAASSFIEFYEGSRRVGTVSGASFPPPVFVSSTNLLTACFFASGHNGIGFKAFFSFISESVAKEMARPETDCGGFVGSFGGTITMRNVTHYREKLYYCIWLIQPWRNLLDVKRHLYLKITAFMDFAGDAKVQVRRGLTSESPLLASLRHPTSQNFQEHVIPAKTGFYVSLRATFGPASHFAITYAAFSFDDCHGASEFLCENFRCISKKLICDGSDHCGDNSDESGLCYEGGNWHAGVANYYFPKAEQLSGSLLLLVSFVGLVCLLLVLATVAYHSAAKSRRQRDLEDQLQAISDLRDSFSDEVSVENVVIDDPPSYESPPTYEDVMKMQAALMVVSTREVSGDCADMDGAINRPPARGSATRKAPRKTNSDV